MKTLISTLQTLLVFNARFYSHMLVLLGLWLGIGGYVQGQVIIIIEDAQGKSNYKPQKESTLSYASVDKNIAIMAPTLTHIQNDNNILEVKKSPFSSNSYLSMLNESQANANELMIYPNPTSYCLNVSSYLKAALRELRIINQSGEIVYHCNAPKGTLQVNNVIPGRYTLSLRTDTETKYKSFIFE